MKRLWWRFMRRVWWDTWQQQFVEQLRCGFFGHGSIVYYRSSGSEPDYTCSRCGIDTNGGEHSRAFWLGVILRDPRAWRDPSIRAEYRYAREWVLVR